MGFIFFIKSSKLIKNNIPKDFKKNNSIKYFDYDKIESKEFIRLYEKEFNSKPK